MSPCSSCGDEAERVPDGGQEDVAARLVGLGLQPDPEVVALGLDVRSDRVQALPVAVQGGVQVLGAVVLGPLAATPHHEGGGTHLGGEVDRGQHLAQAEAAYRAVVGGQPAVLEDRVGEGVGGDHLDHQSGLVRGVLEPTQPLPLGGLVGVEGEDVVVVEGDPPGAELGEPVGVLPGIEDRPGGRAERVDARPAHRPQSEGEPVVGCGSAHESLLSRGSGVCGRAGTASSATPASPRCCSTATA